MNREEFGRLVAALRKENMDLATGSMWTQNKLADITNLSIRTIGEIERGAKANLDPHTLAQLAQGFGLSTMERTAFYTAAAEVDVIHHTAPSHSAETILAELKEALRTVRLPAYIHDAYFNVVAANAMMRDFSLVSDAILASGEGVPAGHNLMRYYFAPEGPLRALFNTPSWPAYAVRNMQHFRAASLKYRHTERFARVFEDLCQYPLFRDFWLRAKYTEQDIYRSWGAIEYVHPILGAISHVVNRSLTLTIQGDLYLVIFAPCNRQTTEKFEEIARQVGGNILQLTAWPYPDEG